MATQPSNVVPFNLSQIIKAPDTLVLYNPNDFVADGKYNSKDYHFGKNEVVAISGYDVPSTDERGQINGTRHISARDIVLHLVGEDGESGQLGPVGVRPLFVPLDDPANIEKNEAIKASAREKATYAKYVNARNDIKTHEAGVAKARAEGTQIPFTNPDLLSKYEYVRDYEGGAGRPVATHPCDVCNLPCYNEGELLAHKANVHGLDRDGKTGTGGMVQTDVLAKFMENMNALLEKANTKPKRGRPRKAKV